VYVWNIEQGSTSYVVYGVNGYSSNALSYSSNAHTYLYYPVLGWIEQGTISCTITFIVGSNPTGNCSYMSTGVWWVWFGWILLTGQFWCSRRLSRFYSSWRRLSWVSDLFPVCFPVRRVGIERL